MFVSLVDGMDVLPRTLAERLGPEAIQTDCPVRRISRRGDRAGWLVESLNGPPIEADVVIATTEAHATARMLDNLDPSLALQLRSIPYASSVIVNVAYRRDQVKHPLDGFGVVVPAIESRSILAASFLNVKFPSRAPSGSALIRVFIGGATQPDLFDLDDEGIREIVARELGDLIGVTGEPLFLEIGRHPRAMPQYVLGHLERVESIRRKAAKHPNLFLTGIAFDGVGIPDCVRAAESTADAVVATLAGGGSIAAA
jgi:oxygen-dependent protoporphyrinogen oxidase